MEQRKRHNDYTIHDTIVLRDINSATRVPEFVVPTREGTRMNFPIILTAREHAVTVPTSCDFPLSGGDALWEEEYVA